MKHPGNPAKMPDGHVPHTKIVAFERACEEGMICWFCTDPAVSTLVEPSMEPVWKNGQWRQDLVHRPVCGPGSCLYGYGP